MSHPQPSSRREFLRATVAAGLGGALAARPTNATGRAESPWQIGCYTRPWDKHDYRVALDEIVEAGYTHAGLMTAKGKTWVMITPATTAAEADQIAEEVRKRDLKVLSVYSNFTVKEPLAQSIDDLRRVIDHCAAVGSPNLLLGGNAKEAEYQGYYRTIAECCDQAAERGVGLSIKPHGGLNATGAQCRKAIELVGHRNFGLWYDPGNIFFYSDGALDPVDDAAEVDGLVVGMSIKDFQAPKEVSITPGTGRVDFAGVLARLRRGGFARGPLVVETLAPGEVAQITSEARKTLQFLKDLTASASS